MDDRKGRCPRCGGAARFHLIMAFAPPNPSWWDCPACGAVPVSDETGRVIDYSKQTGGGLT